MVKLLAHRKDLLRQEAVLKGGGRSKAYLSQGGAAKHTLARGRSKAYLSQGGGAKHTLARGEEQSIPLPGRGEDRLAIVGLTI